jgi:hypothetical protein
VADRRGARPHEPAELLDQLAEPAMYATRGRRWHIGDLHRAGTSAIPISPPAEFGDLNAWFVAEKRGISEAIGAWPRAPDTDREPSSQLAVGQD